VLLREAQRALDDAGEAVAVSLKLVDSDAPAGDCDEGRNSEKDFVALAGVKVSFCRTAAAVRSAGGVRWVKSGGEKREALAAALDWFTAQASRSNSLNYFRLIANLFLTKCEAALPALRRRGPACAQPTPGWRSSNSSASRWSRCSCG